MSAMNRHRDKEMANAAVISEAGPPAAGTDLPAAVAPDSRDDAGGSVVVSVDGVDVAFTRSGGRVRVVFRDLCFQVREGELVCIVGKSGGGKTTLLNLLVGLLEPTAGEVTVLGRRPRHTREQLSFMSARDALIPSRNAQRNVEFGLELRGVHRQRRQEVAERYLAMMGLPKDAARLWPWQLSQGMRQRVALARALALEAEILLLDEPFAALDAQTRERIQSEFLSSWAIAKRTALFVTHDLEEAIFLGDRIVVIGDGRVVANLDVPMGRPRDRSTIMENVHCRALAAKIRALLI
jgi:NitT/TauT family transport system ATP-binding protein